MTTQTSQTTLSGTGTAMLWVVSAMVIARIGFGVPPLVYILGADNWTVLYWIILYTIFFGANFVIHLAVTCVALMQKENSNQIFGKSFTSWNPLRRFYTFSFFCFVDFAVTLAVWYTWLHRNDIYLKSPNNSNTPDPNTQGFFAFQALCGAFIFASVIHVTLAYQFLRSLKNQRQEPLNEKTPGSTSNLTPAQVAASRQFNPRNGVMVNVELSPATAPGLSKTKKNVTKRYWFTGLTVVWIVVLLVYLFIYFYHTFNGATKMQFVVVNVFFWLSLFFFLILILIYYVPFGENSPSICADNETQETDGLTSTAETNAELNYEMGGVFVSSVIFYFINIVFLIYAYVLDGPNKLGWNTVPTFNSLAVVQSPFFYVWTTNAALNTGAIVFFTYHFVTIGFVIGWGSPSKYALFTDIDDDLLLNEEEATFRPKTVYSKGNPNQQAFSEDSSASPEVTLHDGKMLFLTGIFFACWFVFFSFIIDAMLGGRFLASHIFPITVVYGVVFFFIVLIFLLLIIFNINNMNNGDEKNKKLKIWQLNKHWYLSTYRSLACVPLAYVLQLIILSYLTWEYFERDKIDSDWTCIRPIDPSTPPPYDSCNIYWSVSITSLYCINLVYLIILCNMASTTSIRIYALAQAKGTESKQK